MPQLVVMGLARPEDARDIAEMSRDAIERGLGWSWTPARVCRFITGRENSVVVARRGGELAAFAMMRFGDDSAHLHLLAVAEAHRRQGIGRRLIGWLEATAVEAGVRRIDLELRAGNRAAFAFYERLGFSLRGEVPGYYQGRETALRMSRPLARNPC